MISVSILVLNYNTYAQSKKCIDSCLKQKGCRYRVVLVDNCSTDDSYIKLKTLYGDQIDYLQNTENFGFAKGNNLGVEWSVKHGYTYSLMLNSDTEIVGDTYVKQLADIFSLDSTCAVVAPTIYRVTSKSGLILEKNDSVYLKLLRLSRVIPKNKVIDNSVCRICEAHGSALMVDNKFFMKVGGFPEHYFMYGEESTMSKKVLWEGRSIDWLRTKEQYVLHHHDLSNGFDKWRLYLQGRNRALEFFENRNSHKPFAWTLVYILFVVQYSIMSKSSSQQSYLKGMSDARKLVQKNTPFQELFLHGRNMRDLIIAESE